jgi:hypothetical protein
LYKGDISNRLAFGFGIDLELLIEKYEPPFDPFGLRREWVVSDVGRVVIPGVAKRDFRSIVYGITRNYGTMDQEKIRMALDAWPITRLEWVDSWVDLGNNHLRDTDLYYTASKDFQMCYRMRGNVRIFIHPAEIWNYLRGYA